MKRFFCIPFAGGSANFFLKWKSFIDKSIEFCPVELAGRGRRSGVPLYTTLDEAIEDIYRIINKQVDDSPYLIWGHSMGAILAYELFYRLKKGGFPLPVSLFVSGRAAPHIGSKTRIIHTLPYDEFKEEIINFGGKSVKDIFKHEELIDIFLPIMRADFKIIENYSFSPKEEPLDCNLTVLFSNDDTMSLEESEAWRSYTKKDFKLYSFDGGHFFIEDHAKEIFDIIQESILNRE